MRIGDATIHARDLRKRCVMTTALNCSVVVPGTIRIGDEVTIFER